MVDSFFKKAKKRSNPVNSAQPPKKRRQEEDDDITSESEVEEISESEESEEETVGDKRRRLAKEYLQGLETELGDPNAFDAKDLDDEIISKRLQEDVAENEGKIYRMFGESDNLKVGPLRKIRSQAKHLCAITTCWPFAYTVSKDLKLEKWQLSTNQAPQLVHSASVGSFKYKHLAKLHPSESKKEKYAGHFGEVTCIAVSYNNKYVVTGSRDHRIIVWSTENLSPVKVFDSHDRRGEIFALTFRDKTLQLYVGCGDLKVRTYDLEQLAHVEILYGHQDKIVGISALRQEKCVSVGSRDRTAIVWKIPEESRLTFRGGDTRLANIAGKDKDVVLEGSIDCCAMLDNQFFVTGSDNGNVSLWSTQRKKPVFIYPRAHGTEAPLVASAASAESDASKVEIPPPQPRYITALCAVPFSDIFFTGSWNGSIHMWKLTGNLSKIELIKEIKTPKGLISGLSVTEKGRNEVVVAATVSREHRLGRWINVSGHDTVVSFNVSIA